MPRNQVADATEKAKAQRLTRIVAYRQQGYTLQRIGQLEGISHVRVLQLLQEASGG